MKRWIGILLPLLVLGGLIGWRLNVQKAEARAQEAQREQRKKMVPSVQAADAATRDVIETYVGVGTVEAPFNVKLSARVTGRIGYLQAREGDRVTRGQVLVRIDPAELEAALRQKQSALAEAQSRLAQARLLEAPAVTAVGTQISQQTAQVATAQADDEAVRANSIALEASARAVVEDAQGRIDAADAAIGTAEAAIQSAQANRANAETKLKRQQGLLDKGFVAAQEVDNARTELAVQESSVGLAQAQQRAAQAQKSSAQAQKRTAEKQYEVARNKARADRAAAAARLTQARAALQSARANVAQKPAYQANLAAMQNAVAAAQADVTGAQTQLEYTVVTSPLDGFVTDRNMDPGALATPGQPILTVQGMQQVWVNVSVPEEIRLALSRGQSASVQLDGAPGRTFEGHIVQINPAADPTSRQFVVRIALTNPTAAVQAGMSAKVSLVTRKVSGAVVVPREAVQSDKKGDSVLVIGADDAIERRPVVVGVSDAAGIAIEKGLQPGEKVVTMSAMPLRDGQKVKVGGGERKEKKGQEKG